MQRILILFIPVSVLLLAGILQFTTEDTPNYPPGREPMALPEDYSKDFIHYARVDRIDAKARNLYISPHAVDALLNGEDVPERTIIIIEAYEAARDAEGQPLRTDLGRWVLGEMDDEVHASEMRTTWRIEDMHTTSPSGDWNFARFDLNSSEQIDEDISDCFSCHEAAVHRDFVFSRPLLREYLSTGEVQYQFCARPRREICGF